jgi:hypothetical protein
VVSSTVQTHITTHVSCCVLQYTYIIVVGVIVAVIAIATLASLYTHTNYVILSSSLCDLRWTFAVALIALPATGSC